MKRRSIILFFGMVLFFAYDNFAQNTSPMSDASQSEIVIKCGETPDLDAIIEKATKDLEYSKYDLRAYLRRGIAYFYKNDYEKSLLDAEKILELNPQEVRAYYLKGDVYKNLGNYEKSLQAYQRSIEIDPENDHVYYNIAYIYEAKEEYQKASETISKAISLEPYDPLYLYFSGTANFHLKNYPFALNDYREALKLVNKEIKNNTDNRCADEKYTIRGMIYVFLNNYREALSDYNKAIELDVNNHEGFYYRAELNIRLKKYKAAISDLTTAINISPNSARNYILRAEAFRKNGEPLKAEADNKKATDLQTK